jgi:hypothetical protein
MTVKPAIIPGLRYKDAPRAIDFLCDAFGFKRHAVYPDPNNPSVIMHAQLIDRGNMIMLGSGTDNDYKNKAGIKSVAEAGGSTTWTPMPNGPARPERIFSLSRLSRIMAVAAIRAAISKGMSGALEVTILSHRNHEADATSSERPYSPGSRPQPTHCGRFAIRG